MKSNFFTGICTILSMVGCLSRWHLLLVFCHATSPRSRRKGLTKHLHIMLSLLPLSTLTRLSLMLLTRQWTHGHHTYLGETKLTFRPPSLCEYFHSTGHLNATENCHTYKWSPHTLVPHTPWWIPTTYIQKDYRNMPHHLSPWADIPLQHKSPHPPGQRTTSQVFPHASRCYCLRAI